MSDEQRPTGTTRRSRLIAAAVGVVVIALILLLVLPRLDDDGGAAAPSPTPPAATESPSDAPPPDQAPSASGPSGSGSPSDGAGESSAPGDDSTRAPEGEVNAQPPLTVAIDQPAEPTDDLVVSVTRVESVRSQAELPGETSRPALRITVQVENTSSAAVPIGGALTNLYYGPDRDAAVSVQRPGGRAFPESVPAGGTATSVVIYNVPPAARDDVVLEVSLDATVRRVEFSGSCSSSC